MTWALPGRDGRQEIYAPLLVGYCIPYYVLYWIGSALALCGWCTGTCRVGHLMYSKLGDGVTVEFVQY